MSRTAGVQSGACRRLTLLAAAVGVTSICSLGAACGGSSKGTATPPAAGAPSGTSASQVTTDKITIHNFAFHPQTVTVPKGTTVTWTNTDATPHTVQSANKAFPTSPLMLSGAASASYSQTFNTAGAYSYICGIHPYMTGKIIVTP